MPRTVATAGERDKLVTIEALTDATDDSGFPTETPTTLGTAWMEKIDVSGTEEFKAGQLSAPYNTRFRMDYQSNMDPDLIDVPKTRRLVYRGRRYDIASAGFVDGTNGQVIELRTLSR